MNRQFSLPGLLEMTLAFVCTCLIISCSVAQTVDQQDKPRVPNKGAGVSDEIVNAFESKEFDGMPYRLLLPAGFDPTRKYPLLLSLHGGAGVGNDNKSNLRNWCATFVDTEWRAKYPCIVVVPQAPGRWQVTGEKIPVLTESLQKSYSDAWQKRIKERNYPPGPIVNGSLSRALKLIDHLSSEYKVDTNRVYVIGHSMGGFGAWNAIWAAPQKFAAAIPSSGGLLPWKDPAEFKQVPVWAFHGELDQKVPTDFTREIFTRLQKVGGNVKFTQLKSLGHGTAKDAFSFNGDSPEEGYVTHYSSEKCDKTVNVWDWLFAQRLDKR